MASFYLSRLAEVDLLNIGDYTLRAWGVDQAIRYLDALSACCERLAANPAMGRPCDAVRPGLRRIEHAKHFLFYRTQSGGILVSRILHERMLPERQDFEDEDSHETQ